MILQARPRPGQLAEDAGAIADDDVGQREPENAAPRVEPHIDHQRAGELEEPMDLPELIVCPICRIHQKDRALTPCGHTICRLCSNFLTGERRCFICRQIVDLVVPIFI